MFDLYPYPPRVSFEDPGVVRSSWYNVELAALVQQKAGELLNTVHIMDHELQRTFLQALFDDEGCVSFCTKRGSRLARAYQYNLATLELAQVLLGHFDIESRIDSKQVELVIGRKENLLRFRNEIGFSPSVRVNGKRSNSVWKQSLEKREILKHAIASYLPPGTPGVHTP